MEIDNPSSAEFVEAEEMTDPYTNSTRGRIDNARGHTIVGRRGGG